MILMLNEIQAVKGFYFSLLYMMLEDNLKKCVVWHTQIFWDRNVLVESARIARGKIQDLKDLKVQDFDAVIFPGGFGAAKNL